MALLVTQKSMLYNIHALEKLPGRSPRHTSTLDYRKHFDLKFTLSRVQSQPWSGRAYIPPSGHPPPFSFTAQPRLKLQWIVANTALFDKVHDCGKKLDIHTSNIHAQPVFVESGHLSNPQRYIGSIAKYMGDNVCDVVLGLLQGMQTLLKWNVAEKSQQFYCWVQLVARLLRTSSDWKHISSPRPDARSALSFQISVLAGLCKEVSQDLVFGFQTSWAKRDYSVSHYTLLASKRPSNPLQNFS